MKRKGKWKKMLFIGVLVLFFIAFLLNRYFPFSKLIRISAAREFPQSVPENSGSGPPNSITFGFELSPGQEAPKGIVEGNAHSGRYAAKAFGKNSFSPALERQAGELGTAKLAYAAISAWVYIKPGGEPVTAALVFAASNAMGVNICWKGIGLKDPGVPRGKWFKMSGQFDLRDVRFRDDSRIQIYFWNNSSNDILVDDYFLAYGGPVPRKGDTTYVDLTRGPFTEKYNYPPFRVITMNKEAGSGKPNDGLEIAGEGGMISLSPSWPMISGCFLPGNQNRDALLVMPAEGKPELFTFCTESASFSGSPLDFPFQLSWAKGKQYLLKGRFTEGETEQLLYIGEKLCALFRFSCRGPVCRSSAPAEAGLLWQSEGFAGLPFDPGRPLVCGDFNGDGLAEVLYAGTDGSWKLFRFRTKAGSGSWDLLAEGKETCRDWSGTAEETSLSPGHFLPARSQDGILAVCRDSHTRRCSYTLRYYSSSLRSFVPFFKGRNGISGGITGIDTLKPGDRFFIVNTGGTASPAILRYNRDWRFDLKQIAFSDSSYRILYNVDFAGYEADHNPKYYGVLRLIPGKYTGTHTSFIVIGKNCRNRGYDGKECDDYEELPGLPGFISLYSFSRP